MTCSAPFFSASTSRLSFDGQQRLSQSHARSFNVVGVAAEVAFDAPPRLVECLTHRLERFRPIGGAVDELSGFHEHIPVWPRLRQSLSHCRCSSMPSNQIPSIITRLTARYLSWAESV
jgi:hypothetical protein